MLSLQEWGIIFYRRHNIINVHCYYNNVYCYYNNVHCYYHNEYYHSNPRTSFIALISTLIASKYPCPTARSLTSSTISISNPWYVLWQRQKRDS